MTTEKPRYLHAYLEEPDEDGVTALVAYGMTTTDGEVVYLIIRYFDYENHSVQGDHLYMSFNEAMDDVFKDYALTRSSWRELSAEEILRIDARIG